METDLEDLIDSIDSDESDWTRRGIVKLISFSKHFRAQVDELEKMSEKTRYRIAMFTMASALCSVFSSTGILITLINDIINLYFKESGATTLKFGSIIVGFVFNVITTILVAFLKVKSYEEKLQSSAVCATGYMKLLNDVNSEIYKKAKNRTPMSELFAKINAEYSRLYNIQSTILEMNTRQLTIDCEALEKRLSGEQKNDKIKEVLSDETNDNDV